MRRGARIRRLPGLARPRGGFAQRAAGQARATVDHAHATWKWNPRRLRTPDRSTFNGYRVTISAAERLAEQLRSVASGFLRIAERDSDQRAVHEEFLHRYGTLLTAVGAAVERLGAIHTVDDLKHGPGLDGAGERCRTALEALRVHTRGHPLDLPTDWAVFGGLYTDAERLCDDVDRARDTLREVAV
ncbi:hypothetical protein ACN27E_18680 [Mycobacterium sp. WMMD1722]|uniref:hypothetical protein n=1 Tax=Mycobacterium sp. WMMD1722 TaxID=3404117 RepID=UPI003BF5E7B2